VHKRPFFGDDPTGPKYNCRVRAVHREIGRNRREEPNLHGSCLFRRCLKAVSQGFKSP